MMVILRKIMTDGIDALEGQKLLVDIYWREKKIEK